MLGTEHLSVLAETEPWAALASNSAPAPTFGAGCCCGHGDAVGTPVKLQALVGPVLEKGSFGMELDSSPLPCGFCSLSWARHSLPISGCFNPLASVPVKFVCVEEAPGGPCSHGTLWVFLKVIQ